MLYIIQSRYPITVADVNLCVVGIKQCLSSKIQKKYEEIIIKNPPPPPKKKVLNFNMSEICMQG